ncbi:hypothetical protein GCAAIG_14025 [Candidatus Electronema halotolerans]
MMNLRTVFLRVVLLQTLLFLLLAPLALRAATPAVPSSPPERVVDLASIIDSTLEGELASALRELEKKTTAQMAILTVSSLDGQDIESFSLHVAEQWKLGQKGKDNGLLLTVALKERKYRFETGYGLEGALPDSLLGSIGRKNMVPFFKKGEYGEGIAAATTQVFAVLAKHYNVQLDGVKELPESEPSLIYSIGCKIVNFGLKIFMWIAIVVFIGIVLTIIILAIFDKDKSSCCSRSSDNDSWSNSSDSSSWSSSSDSDFSGGGGDFGGGGDSGDW